jgi:UDP-N-acetylglucosamine 4-epimerase
MIPHTLLTELKGNSKRWLVTGVAGFIGSHLLETLLQAGQFVTGLDNFATGRQANLNDVKTIVGPEAWTRFDFIRGDVRSLEDCRAATDGVDFVLHHAALASVPLSIKEPILTNESNIDGFLNLLVASREQGVKRFIYASSSAVYGNEPGQPKREENIGRPLSPYALTKWMNEQYADLFGRVYGLETIGLRYFNVFGRRQDPQGPYAAVIPIWIASLLRGNPCLIHGDGQNTRDFCHVNNIVYANLLAASKVSPDGVNQAFNVAGGGSISLNDLEGTLRTLLSLTVPSIANLKPVYGPPRGGDVIHSQAELSRAAQFLGYRPQISLQAGLEEARSWYITNL